MPRETRPTNPAEIAPLDPKAENWMAEHRLERLQARGWQGTLDEYLAATERLGGADPLEQSPPITR